MVLTTAPALSKGMAARFSAGWLLLSCALAACAGARAPAPAHVLRIADLVNPSSLNPLLAHDQETIGDDLLICQTLIGLDERNRLVPVLITRIPTRTNGDISADGARITYHLRRGTRFADGAALTASDVAFTYRAILDGHNAVLSQDAYRRIASLTTPDPYTVIVRLKRPWNAAVSDLFAQSDFAFGILPAHAFTGTQLRHAAWDDRAFGSGPFRVKEWRRGDRVILTPNPYFSPRPRLREVVLQMIPDFNTAFVALRTGGVDVAELLPGVLPQAAKASGLRVLRTPENGTVWLTLQSATDPGNDPSVRRAIASALDMRALRKTFNGVYPQAGSFLPPVLAWHDPALASPPYNLGLARRLLRGRSIDARLVMVTGNALYERIATVVQQQLAAADIRVAIKTFPAALFNAPEGPIRNARFTIAIDGWLGGADPEQSVVFLCSQATVDGDNISRYCDPAFERLFADQQSTRSDAQRKRDFLGMQRLIHSALPVVPLYYTTHFDGVAARVRGFRRNMLRYPVGAETWDADAAAR